MVMPEADAPRAQNPRLLYYGFFYFFPLIISITSFED